MPGYLRRLTWPAVVVAIVLAIYLMGKARPVEVEMAQTTRGRIEEFVTEEAQTQLDVERTVTADFPGTLQRITLEEGDPVTAGQVVATIEDTQLREYMEVQRAEIREVEAQLEGVDVPLPKPSEVAAAEEEKRRAGAELEMVQEEKRAAEAELQYAREEFARVENLFESGTATRQQLDTARRNLDVARANLDALSYRLTAAQTGARIAELRRQVLDESMADTAHLRDVYAAQIEQNRNMLDLLAYEIAKTRVTSPIDGVILEKHIDSEQYVQQGTPLLKIGDVGSIEVRADILSDEIGRVELGQPVHLVGRAIAGANAAGTVKKIYPSGFTKISSLGVRQQRVAVLIGFDNSGLGLQPGYELDVKIVVAARDDVVLVPSAAVFAGREGSAVFVVERGRARLRPVEIGLRGEDLYEVTAGLEAGEVVVLRPPTGLKPGGRVKEAQP